MAGAKIPIDDLNETKESKSTQKHDFPEGNQTLAANMIGGGESKPAKVADLTEAGEAKEAKDGEDATLSLQRNKKPPGKAGSVSIIRLFQFADKIDVFLMILGSLGAMVTGASQPFMTVLFGQIINAFGQNAGNRQNLIDEVGQVALRYVYLSLVACAAAYFAVACWMVTSERQAARIRSQYLRAILRQDIAFFDTDTSTGEVVSRMAGDTALIQEAMGEKFSKVVQLLSTFFGGYIVAFTRSWKLTLVVMGIMPLIVICGGATGFFMAKTTMITQKAYAHAGDLVDQAVGSIRTVAAYSGESKATEDYDKNLIGAQKAGTMQGLALGLGFGGVMGCLFLAYSLALWYGGTLVLNDGLNGGQVINVIFAVLTGAMAITQGSPCLSAIATGRAAAYSIFQVIKRIPAIDVQDTGGLVPETVKGVVELRDVTFRYPSRPEVIVFNNFSVKIPAGKTVALVGESGSGKSTVVSLIERFYDPEAGAVLLDDVDIRTLQLKWLRRQIGLVSQEPVLFSASIKDNIAYGKEDATMEEIEAAASFANAAQFIGRVPKGYDTMVGERGIQLSGGQKQRVAIARAILKNPHILLLDEATSALDAQSERVVQNALDRVMANRTTVVVAHRLTTIRNADMIAVVDHGVIVETGTHSELVRKEEGAYSQLIRLQEVYSKTEEKKKTGSVRDPDFIDDTIIEDTEEPPIPARETTVRRSADFELTAAMEVASVTNVATISSVSNANSNGISTPARRSFSSVGDIAKVTDGITAVLSRISWAGNQEDAEMAKGKAGGKDEKNVIKDVSALRLAKLNKPEWPTLLLGVAAASSGGLVFPVFGLLLSNAINAFFEPRHQLKKDVNFWAGMFVVLAIGAAALTPARLYYFGVAGQKLIRRVRRMTFEKVVHQEVGWFDLEENSSGAISSRLSSDAAAVRSIVGDAISMVVQNLATIIAAVAIAFTGTWQLTFVMLAVVPLLGAQGIIQVRWMKGFGQEVKEKYEEASRLANDAVSSVRTVASFVAEDKICDMYDAECRKPVQTGIKQGLIGGVALAFGNLVLFNTFAMCFWVGGKLVENGSTTFKDVFRVFFAISLSANSVTQTTGLSPDFAKVKVSVNSIFAMLDRKSKIDSSDLSGRTPTLVTGDIEFKRVSFFYPTRPDIQIFQELSFKVQTGQTIALVGESGSGKSTVVSLIERFYDPQSGVVLMDGVDIKKLQIKWLRQQIGLVSQEPVLFDENVDWNIVYGQESSITQAEIQEAAESANAHKFISALPDGYKTRVGERGTQLSGGQKQRVAIARAILKDPKILLLDEATSALDAESEHVVQEALDRIMVHRTTVVIAHRLSTVRNADIIAVVKNGAIVEQGKHDELMTRDGAYASLIKLHSN